MMNHLLESGHCLILLALGLDQFTLGDVERKMGAFGRTIGSAAWAVLSRDRQLDLLLTVYLLCNKAGRSMIIGVVFEVDCAVSCRARLVSTLYPQGSHTKDMSISFRVIRKGRNGALVTTVPLLNQHGTSLRSRSP